MDDDVDSSYPSSPYGTKCQSFSLEDENSAQNVGNQFTEDGDNDDDDGANEDIDDEVEDKAEEDEEEDDDDDEGKGVLRIGEDDYGDLNEDGDEDDDFGDLQRHPKKRKLKTLSNYEFAPRAQALPSGAALIPKPSYGGRNPLTDWTEHETFILLDAWGERFLKQGRKSLRSEEWQEVAEKVSQESKIERTDTQCRNRLDTLKKKYKKEKMKLGETGESTSKWACYKKMDLLLSSIPQKAGHLSAVDSGEHLKDHLNYSNGLHETRDSPDNSISTESVPPKKVKKSQIKGRRASSFKRLADSIQKFVGIYEKIENSKRERMLELEKMRMDFHRDLELQKRQILEKSQAEIAKIRKGDDEEYNMSAENDSV
ncbi:trihelix transcription factor ENAP2-like [Primulina tabacum]|uniref:trihelix transcription factor ENAP2-like n=1 Tax=Primulina tabacum TaxID=48773 RepID=UPI003F593E2C